jgi:hypothetical protein
MRRKWEQYLSRMGDEAPRIRQEMQPTSREDLKVSTEERTQELQPHEMYEQRPGSYDETVPLDPMEPMRDAEQPPHRHGTS